MDYFELKKAYKRPSAFTPEGNIIVDAETIACTTPKMKISVEELRKSYEIVKKLERYSKKEMEDFFTPRWLRS